MPAEGACSVKIGTVPLDLTVEILSCKDINMIKTADLQICHVSAVRADKVIMRRSIRIKPFRTCPGGDLLNLSEPGKQGEIAVDRTETDVRIFPAYILIYRLCGRMITPPREKIPYGFPLSAVF